MSHQESSRNPRGLATRKPISLRLMPCELDQADSISGEFGITKSKLARDAYLAGLQTVIDKLSSTSAADSSPSATAADFSGGEASASSSGLSSIAA